MLKKCAIVAFAYVHAAVALLSAGERLGPQIDAQLSPCFPSCVVLYGRRCAQQSVADSVDGRCQRRADSAPQPLYRWAQDAVALAVSVREATALGFERCLDISGARCEARLQRSGDLVLHWCCERLAADVQAPKFMNKKNFACA